MKWKDENKNYFVNTDDSCLKKMPFLPNLNFGESKTSFEVRLTSIYI